MQKISEDLKISEICHNSNISPYIFGLSVLDLKLKQMKGCMYLIVFTHEGP